MATVFEFDAKDIESLQEAMEQFQGDTEATINDVLHNDGGEWIQDAIRKLIPVSGKEWKGKKPAAKSGKSLTNIPGNLSITVTTTSNYHYLYFPDDGTNTRRHVGNQQFFYRGAENVKDEIIERCISRLTNKFEGV